MIVTRRQMRVAFPYHSRVCMPERIGDKHKLCTGLH